VQIEEKDKAFASPFYSYGSKNGDPEDGGFPPTTIIWIHHDNAHGDARGTRYLIAAMDEQWHLRATTEEERESLRERGTNPSNCRMIQIKKSRLGRQGDLLVVERDENFAYSVADYTPTERREDNGNGAPEPHTMALRNVRDRVKEACEEGATVKDRMSAKEVWERLVEEMNGQLRKPPSSRTVKRWLDRWVEDGVLALGKKVTVEGADKPVVSYTLPPSCARALRKEVVSFALAPRKPLQEQGNSNGQAEAPESVVHCSEAASHMNAEHVQPVPKSNGQRPDQELLSIGQIPVPEGDLRDQLPNDTNTHTKEEPDLLHDEAPELGQYLGSEDIGEAFDD
jgi:hypothetical protein